MSIDFSHIPSSIKEKSNSELTTSIFIFKAVRYKWLICFGQAALPYVLWVPGIKFFLRKTVFNHFCGGETLDDTKKIIQNLAAHNVNAISDYSAEQSGTKEKQEETRKNILQSIKFAAQQKNVPFACVKITGICARPLLEKISKQEPLTGSEQEARKEFDGHLDALCRAAAEQGKKIFIDTEETWINPAINEAAERMMAKYNREKHVVYTTIQFYTTGSLAYLQHLIDTAPYKVALKLVRGAYHEQENERAIKMGYPSPILPNKEAVDRNYNEGLRVCIKNLGKVSFCAATHNAGSIELLMQLMKDYGVEANSDIVSFSQLYGMRDNLTYELAGNGYNVSKYIPYGPLKETLPYLIRRAQENAGISEQMGDELQLLLREKQARVSSNSKCN
ncbi:MAG: proline dehydrogenase family protein [Prevotellaceae bacterium]|jgi:proline dehydrogenase|nr:proline dehydrogenase family protein [Prevotellaceae bacterium]